MATIKFDEIGEWSRMKHAIIAAYADGYSQILNAPKQNYLKSHYIDGFCGAGEHIDADTGKQLRGSPLLVLDAPYPFHHYYFIDRDSAKTENLRALCAQKHPDKTERISIKTGDCNKILSELLPLFSFGNYDRILCLLDPYGLHLDWEIIRQMGQLGLSERNGKGIVDLVINFSVMDMNRNAIRRDPTKAPQWGVDKMNRFWGDKSWKDIVYQPSPQGGLFGAPEIEKQDNATLAEAFRARLRDVAGFKYVPKPIPMRNSNKATVYYLFFASQNKTADKIASHLFCKYGEA